jgi:hypothetical protein
MTQAEEVPPTGVSGTANSTTYVRIDRDSTGNVVGGAVSFNLNLNMGSGPLTFTGLHIHNGKFGTNAGVVINSGLSAANPVVSPDGGGTINREVEIESSNATAFDSLRGLIENPEAYYINIHTTQFGGGIVRAQLARETYRFKANMSPANEVPPITSVDTAATGWITARINRDANGVINGGTVAFDLNFTNTGAITFTGLHIHHPGAAGVNASVVINTGISGTAPVESASGSGNITRVVNVESANTAGIAALAALITAPDTAYVNLHSTQFTGGVVRSQMFPVSNVVAQVAGGGEWLSSITIRNPSTTAAVQGILDLFQSSGTIMPEGIADPHMSFLIPPSGSVTYSTHNKGSLIAGFARVFSNGPVAIESRYLHPVLAPGPRSIATVTARGAAMPVSVGGSARQNTGIALLAGPAAQLTLSLRDSGGNAIAGGSRTIDVGAGQHVAAFVTELLPSVTQPQFSGTLTITSSAGSISALALQFNGTLFPVTVTPVP